MQELHPALSALAAWPQFVTWFAAPHPTKPGKFNKFPCDWRTGTVTDAHDPAIWTTADVALNVAAQWDRGHGSGAGFVFTTNDPFFFADIDGALEVDGWSPLAMSILARFPGAAVEVSHSGKGLHVIGRAAPVAHNKKNTPLALELYTEGRFAALTGTGALGDAGTEHSPALAQYVADYFQPTVTGDVAEWTAAPVPEWEGPTDDEELLAKALNSGQRTAAAAFGGAQATFRNLWEADVDALARVWPGEGLKPYGASEADQALAGHLAFWTGKDCERMERLMRRSALARDKWDAHRTYLADTIVKACSFIRTVATGHKPPLVETVAPEVMAAAALEAGRTVREAGREYMSAYEQIEYFDGCYYATARNEMFVLGRNELMNKSAFDVVYGGYLFTMDPANAKTSPSAWEAFTQSRVNVPRVVNDICFRPQLASGALIHDGSRTLVNSYVPFDAHTLEGDPGPFLDLLARMLPDAHDRAILLNYMASLVQNPGVKFQWWPVIQGAKGNGKTMLLRFLSYAVGEEYTHLPNVSAMAKTGMQFNDWVQRKLFVGLEEIKTGDRREFLEDLKTLVTGERLGMEAKGGKQFTGDNYANGAVVTNHQDGLPIDADERRYAVFFCAQQSKADRIRDGLNETYFHEFHQWRTGRGKWAASGANYGMAVVSQYLRTFAIDAALDPAGISSDAPRTSSTQAAIAASLGRVEQEILEAIEQGRPGFCGGWVSSHYLDALIDQMRAGVPRAKRRALMQPLGYDWHPHLHNGRVNDTVMPDNAKPKLYLRHGHLALNATAPAEIARLYSKAQTDVVAAAAFRA